jgi:hypothetical protein
MISEKKKYISKNIPDFTSLFFAKNQHTPLSFFFFSQMCTGSGTTAHNPRSGGDPRLEGDPTPRRREPPQPEPVACRAHSHGLEVTHGQGCRSGGDPRPSLPPGVAMPTGMSFAASPSLSPWIAEISVSLVAAVRN